MLQWSWNLKAALQFNIGGFVKSIVNEVISRCAVFWIGFSVMSSQNAFAASTAQADGGLFSVQVSEELKPFANFQLKTGPVHHGANLNSIEFLLPVELVGTEISLSMVRDDAHPQRWIGKNIEARCMQARVNFNCGIRFRNLKIEQGKVEEVINSLEETTADKMNRIQVAQTFAIEQVGYLSLTLKP
jgi:hypothetical protein